MASLAYHLAKVRIREALCFFKIFKKGVKVNIINLRLFLNENLLNQQEKAIYSLHWKMLFIGPLNTTALN